MEKLTQKKLEKKISENNWNKKHPGKDSSSFGKKASEETKNKIRTRMIGNKFAVGYKMSDDHKNKIIQTHKGKIVSEETKRKIRETKIGSKNPMYGKTLSDETKRKIREKNIGAENHMYGKKHSDETKRKMSESQNLRYSERKSENDSMPSAPSTCEQQRR